MNNSFIDRVRAYYFTHFNELDQSHQFHFASRTAAWSPDIESLRLLEDLRASFVRPPHGRSQREHLKSLIKSEQSGRRVAHELRLQYFERYHDLYGLEKAIFRIRHLKYVYGIDISQDFFAIYSNEKLDELKQRLSQDHDALRILSSFAVNMFYISTFALDSTSIITPDEWYEIGLYYDETIPHHLQLLIYLYTHTIIGDSNFYAREIPAEYIPIYTKMLHRLEKIINDHFTDISLDNKLEFLVVSRIIKFQSNLTGRIYDEARASLSSDGDFLIERHNTNLRPDRQTFSKAEHRSVLLLLSSVEYQPQQLPMLLNS